MCSHHRTCAGNIYFGRDRRDERSPSRVVRTQYDGQRKVVRDLLYHDHRLAIIDEHKNVEYQRLHPCFHPYVRLKRSFLRTDLPSLLRGAWRRRDPHSDAVPTSASGRPYNSREAESGSPSNRLIRKASKSEIML